MRQYSIVIRFFGFGNLCITDGCQLPQYRIFSPGTEDHEPYIEIDYAKSDNYQIGLDHIESRFPWFMSIYHLHSVLIINRSGNLS